MNIFELLVFLLVTGTLGALTGLAVGSVAGVGAKWAGAGALAGPIVVAVGLTIWIGISKFKKSRSSKAKQNAKS